MEQITEDKQDFVSIDLPKELQYAPRPKNKILVVFQWFVILIAGSGFTYKFIEFTYSIFKTGNDLVQFAITPIVMYVCVAIGFFSLFYGRYFAGTTKILNAPSFVYSNGNICLMKRRERCERLLH